MFLQPQDKTMRGITPNSLSAPWPISFQWHTQKGYLYFLFIGALLWEFYFQKPKQQAEKSRKGGVLRVERKWGGLTQHWHKEWMAVTNGPHCILHERAVRECPGVTETVPATVVGRPATFKQTLLPRAVAPPSGLNPRAGAGEHILYQVLIILRTSLTPSAKFFKELIT